MRKFARYFLIPLLFLLLFVGGSTAALLYRREVYDIVFFPRTHSWEETSGAETRGSDGTTEEEEEPAETDSPDHLGSVLNPDAVGGESAPSDGGNTRYPQGAVSAASLGEGYSLKQDGYQPGVSRLAWYEGIALPSARCDQNGDSLVKLYMGHVLRRSNGVTDVYDGAGRRCFSGAELLTPAYMRDQSGHPLYLYGESYCYISDTDNRIVPIELNDLYRPVLYYDGVQTVGQNALGLHRYCVRTSKECLLSEDGEDITYDVQWKINYYERKYGKSREEIELPAFSVGYTDCVKWGYVNDAGFPVISAKYAFASEFNDNGVAVVADDSGRIYFINRSGRVLLDAFKEPVYLAERNRRPVSMGYYLPDTFGIESLGMFSFSHGWTMVRYCQNDYYNNELVHDSKILVSAEGAKFAIPQGYSLVSYSDGVLLLEKEGKYGYLDYTGKWIAQPIYTYARPFMEGLAVVGFEGGRKCVIDTTGDVVIPFYYNEITDLSGGLMAAWKSGAGWVLFENMTSVQAEGSKTN